MRVSNFKVWCGNPVGIKPAGGSRAHCAEEPYTNRGEMLE